MPDTVLANTLTGVLIVPAFTVTTACPAVGPDPGTEIAVEVVKPLAKVIPPTAVLSVKVTDCPPIGLPPLSTTLKITCEDSCLPAPPVPFKVMLVGVAETN